MHPTTERALVIQRELTTAAAEGIFYYSHWGQDFAYRNLKAVVQNETACLREARGMFSLQELAEIPWEEKRSLGFLKFTLENGTKLNLIPIWLRHYIYPAEIVTCIDGSTTTVEKMDTDSRGGCFAYGFME